MQQQRQKEVPYLSDLQGLDNLQRFQLDGKKSQDDKERGRNFQINVAGTEIVFSFRSGIQETSKSGDHAQQPLRNFPTLNTERHHRPCIKTEATMNSGKSGDGKKKSKNRDDLEDIFKLPLARMPSIVQELVTDMDPNVKNQIKRELLLSASKMGSDLESEDEEEEEQKENPPKLKQFLLKKSASIVSEKALSTKGNFVPLTTLPYDGGSMESVGNNSETLALPRTLESRCPSINDDNSSLVDHDRPDIEVDEIQADDSSLLSVESSTGAKADELLKKLSKRAEEKLLNKSFTSVKSRGGAGLSPRSNFSHLFSIDNVANLLVKPHKERSAKDYKEIHEFMVQKIKFFMRPKDQLSISNNKTPTGAAGVILKMTTEDKMKMYEVMIYKIHQKGDILCEYGSKGDRFFILLEGTVGVKIPVKKFQKSFNSTWDVYHFMLAQFENIRMTHDYRSRETLQMIKMIGVKALRRLDARKLDQLVKFLKDCVKATPVFLEQWPEINEFRLKTENKLISVYVHNLLNQDKERRFRHTVSETVSHERPEKDKIKVKLEIMEHVNELHPGDQFGQDALITKDPRNATCYVMTETAKTAELKKNAYDRILAEKERQRVDVKINQILVFDLFKHLTKRRLKNFYRLFFDAKTQEPFVAHRHSYLYRQGDEVDGVFCLLSGTVKRLKETWKDTAKPRQDQENWDDQHAQEEKEPSGGNYLIREIKRKQAGQIVLTIIQQGETLGLEEIIMKIPKRQQSIQVASENCTYLFLSAKNFREKFINQGQVMKHSLCEKLELMDKLHQELEFKKTAAFRMQISQEATANQSFYEQKKVPDAQPSCKRPNQAFEKKRESVKPSDHQKLESSGMGLARDNNQIQITKLSRQCLELEEKTQHGGDYSASPIRETQANDGTVHHNRRKIQEMVAYMNQRNSVQSRLTSPPLTKDGETVKPLNVGSSFKSPGQPTCQPTCQPSLAQTVHVETEIERLDREIGVEINKANFDSLKMIELVRERRREVALQHKEVHLSNETKAKDMSCHSRIGRFKEKQQCHIFTAIHETKKDRQKMQKSNKTLTIETIKDRLANEAHGISSKWKTERQEEEQVDLHLRSLTLDKRIQRSLKVFKDQLPCFLEYIRQQGADYIKMLNLPKFEKSLIQPEKPKSVNQSQERLIDVHKVRTQHRQLIVRQKTIQDSNLRRRSASMVSIRSPPADTAAEKLASSSKNKELAKTLKKMSTIKSQSSKKRDQSGESGKQIDLLKVFFNWFQHHQLSSKLKVNPKFDRMKSVDVMSENKKVINEKLLQSSHHQTSRFEGTAAIGAVLSETKSGRKAAPRRCFSHFIPSGAMSNFSLRSRSRDIIKSPDMMSPTHLTFMRKSLTRTKNHFAKINRTDDMIPLTEQVSVHSDGSASNRVTFQIEQPELAQDIQSPASVQSKPHRAWIHHRQQSKWLRHTQTKPQFIQTECKVNRRAPIGRAETIPEEQHNKGSTLDSPRSPRQGFLSPQEPPRQLTNEGVTPELLIQTEPHTNRNGTQITMRQAHREDGLKLLKNTTPFAHGQQTSTLAKETTEVARNENTPKSNEQALKKEIEAPRPHEGVQKKYIAEPVGAVRHRQASNGGIIVTGVSQKNLEYMINIQAPTSVANTEQKRIESLKSLMTSPDETTKFDQIRHAIKTDLQKTESNLVGPPPAGQDEPNIFDQIGISTMESKQKEDSYMRPVTKESLQIVPKGSSARGAAAAGPTRIPSKYVLAKVAEPHYMTAVRKVDNFEDKETKGKTGSSAIKTVDFNSHVVGGHLEYVMSMPLNSKCTSENYLKSFTKPLPRTGHQQLQNMLAASNLHNLKADYKTEAYSSVTKNLSGARNSSWATLIPLASNQYQPPQTLTKGAQQAKSMGQFSRPLVPPELQQPEDETSGLQAPQLRNSTLKRQSSVVISIEKGARSAQKIKKRSRMSNLNRKVTEQRPGMRLGQHIFDKVVNYEQHQMKGFLPRTKVFTSQPNPRFSYPESLAQQNRPTTASLNFNSARSEANFQQRLTGQAKKLNRVHTVETFERGVGPDTESPRFTKSSAFLSNMPASGRRRMKSRQLKIVSAKTRQEPLDHQSQIPGNFQSKRFSVKQMGRNIELRHRVTKAKQEEKKPIPQQDAQEYRKFTDRLIQELQLKAKVQSSRGSLLQREERPPLLGSLQLPRKSSPCAVVREHPYAAAHGTGIKRNINLWDQEKQPRDSFASPILTTRNSIKQGLHKRESTVTNNTNTGSNLNLNPQYQDGV